jgi:hypothetical protein
MWEWLPMEQQLEMTGIGGMVELMYCEAVLQHRL